MNPTRLALLAAFDALLTIAVGIAVPLVPLTILWAVHYGAGLDWLAFLRASADIWLLGNGVQFTAMIDSATAATLGVSGVEQPFKVTLAPLAFAFVSVLVGIRVGHRAALGPFRLVSVVVPIAAYAVLSTLVTVAATHPAFVPTLWTGVLVPPAVFGAGVVGGFVVGASVRRDGARRAVAGHGTRSRFDGTLFRVRTVIARVPRGARAVATTALVAGTAAAAGVFLVASVLVAVLIIITYAASIGAYEGVQAGVLGGVIVTLFQIAYVPDVVIWAASWLVGPGFSIGTGSLVSPIGTQLGPMPQVPLLSIVPRDVGPLGFVGIAVPLVFGFVAATLARPRLVDAVGKAAKTGSFLAAGAATGLVGGTVVGVAASCASGAAGPGRLVAVGPDPVVVGAIAAAEVSVGAIVGFVARVRR